MNFTSADFDPVVVDPSLPNSVVAELFRLSRESAKLDYKITFDISENSDIVELAKDVVAMSNSAGGYLILGAGDDGTPVGLSEDLRVKLDESVLRKKIERFVGRSLNIFLNKKVVFQEKNFAIITVLRTRADLLVFQKDGQYSVTSGKKSKTIVVFRSGDVFVRHGSASERWVQEDAEEILRRIRFQAQEEARKAFSETDRDTSSAGRERDVGIHLHGDPEAFEELVLKTLRKHE